jgi:hypothetical protein
MTQLICIALNCTALRTSDTESCFGPDIFILNLGCGIVMTLQEEKKEGGADPGSMIPDDDSEDERCNTENSNSHSNSSSSNTLLTSSMTDKKGGRGFNRNRKYLWLPARSLLVLTGPARYLWSHGIAPRTTDKVKES